MDTIKNKFTDVVAVDSDIPVAVLPSAAPEGITLLDGTFLEFDQRMEVYAFVTVGFEKGTSDPEFFGREMSGPKDLSNFDYARLYLWAVTYEARKGTPLENVVPAQIGTLVPRQAFRSVMRDSIAFYQDMNGGNDPSGAGANPEPGRTLSPPLP